MKLRIGLLANCLALCLGAWFFAAGAHAAAPAWLPVGATGPTVLPPVQSEVQKVFVDAEAGTFTLTARELAAEGLGDVTISTLAGGQSQVENLITRDGAFAAGQRLEGFFVQPGTDINLASGSSLVTSKPANVKEKQVLLAGYDSPETTVPLSYNASAAEVQAALEALTPIGVGNVEVRGGPGGPGSIAPYTITFKGALADTNIAQVEPDSSGLTGDAVTQTITPGGQGSATLSLMAQNIGGASSSGPITLRATLPSGVTMLAPPTSPAVENEASDWSCGTSTASEVICTRDEGVRTGLTVPPINVVIAAAPGVNGGTVQMEISGGGAATATEDLSLTVSTTPAKSGFQTFIAGAYDQNGNFDQRAGGHPFSASTVLFANTVRTRKGYVLPPGELKDITVKLPPGFLGNPGASPGCPESTPTQDCDMDSMVGLAEPITEKFGSWSLPTAVFNTQAPIGYPAKFRFRVAESADLNVVGSLRSDQDYGVDAASLRTPQVDQVIGVFFTFWGEPASNAFDSLRCRAPNVGLEGIGSIRNEAGCRASGAKSAAFLTNPTNCAEQAQVTPFTRIVANTWQQPSIFEEATAVIPPVEGCEELEFKPSFTFRPSSGEAASGVATTAHLRVDQAALVDPLRLAAPHLKDSVVTLPSGVTLNPAAGDGLQACSTAQMGYMGGGFPMPNPMRFNKEPVTCPDASKLGTAEIKTPVLEEPLKGVVYLAAQDENPFKSLLAMYIVIEDKGTGITIKLPGEVKADGQTGQLTAVFTNNPQVPFEDLILNFRGGSRSTLATPDVCGTYTTNGSFTPWSAPESGDAAHTQDAFAVTSGPGGSASCPRTKAERPFNLGFEAGSTHPVGGAASPFTLRITRPDGNQELDRIMVSTPPGLLASLRGLGSCSEAQLAAAQAPGRTGKEEIAVPSCPFSSQVGTTTIGAGVGPSPLYVKTGKVYLSGPYKGAPLSLAFVVPAVAGPFDLGVQVVRTALRINPKTAQVTAESDSIPQILKGIPLLVRDVRVDLDRPGFVRNPTNCEAMAVAGQVTGGSGAVSNISSRFQVGNCANLGFSPSLKLELKGGTKRNKYQKLTATLEARPGDANIAATSVRFPRSIFLAQNHIRTVCTRVQFAADSCPPGSIYGEAEAETPLLDQPLKGPVYLRSSDNPLPDLVVALRGPDIQPIEVELAARTDSKNRGIRNTFDFVPDAPVSKFTLRMRGGNKSLLVSSRDLCLRKERAIVKMRGQNGMVRDFRPVVKVKCKKKKQQKQKKKKQAQRGKKSR